MGKSKVLGSVGDKVVQNAKNSYTATKIANQTGADRQAVKKALNTYSKVAAKNQKKTEKKAEKKAQKSQKSAERLEKAKQVLGMDSDVFDTTGKSSSGYSI